MKEEKQFRAKVLNIRLIPDSLDFSEERGWGMNFPNEAWDKISQWNQNLLRHEEGRYILVFKSEDGSSSHAETSDLGNVRQCIYEILLTSLPKEPPSSPITEIALAYATPKPNAKTRFERHEVV